MSNEIDFSQFPRRSVGALAVRDRLTSALERLEGRSITRNLGLLYTKAMPEAAQAYSSFLEENPNNLGNWTTHEVAFPTGVFEREAAFAMINLYGGDVGAFKGTITSGATEANLFLAWAGRNILLRRVEKGAVRMIGTDLSHYSLSKAADIIGSAFISSPLSRRDWCLDLDGLAVTVRDQYAKGIRGFLIPLTVGYTTTGTIDDYRSSVALIRQLRESLPGTDYFVWLDAAHNGLITPFLDSAFLPFREPEIQGIVVDFHKFGGAPYPAGMVLYRNEIHECVAKPIPYLPQKDATLLGSRPGAAAAAIWTVIALRGKEGFVESVATLNEFKKMFIDGLALICPTAEIVTDPRSLTCGVRFDEFQDGKLPAALEQKYSLHAKRMEYHFFDTIKESLRIYKFYFLPHASAAVVLEFLQDLEKAIKK